MKSSDPDKKKFACAYCGDKFPSKAVRAAHEKFAHVDIEGIFLYWQNKSSLKWQFFKLLSWQIWIFGKKSGQLSKVLILKEAFLVRFGDFLNPEFL